MSCSIIKGETFFFIVTITDYILLIFSIITTEGLLPYACSHLTNTLWALVSRGGENNENRNQLWYVVFSK